MTSQSLFNFCHVAVPLPLSVTDHRHPTFYFLRSFDWRCTLPETNIFAPGKWMVGRLHSFWVSAFFQVRAVSFRECMRTDTMATDGFLLTSFPPFEAKIADAILFALFCAFLTGCVSLTSRWSLQKTDIGW